MTDQKRPDVAIRVARAAGLPIRLGGTIDVGNPDYFERRVRPLLGSDATYLGPVDDRAKSDLLGGARALLFPIDWPEPFGLVMIEATPAARKLLVPGLSVTVTVDTRSAKGELDRIRDQQSAADRN